MKRRLARIKAVQALYQIEMTEVKPDIAIKSVLDEGEASDLFLEAIVLGTIENMVNINELIEAALQNWSLSRISRVDRAILRLAVYEMKYEKEIPVTVSLNEAIDIAKGFNEEEESGKFVNGVLSKVATMIES